MSSAAVAYQRRCGRASAGLCLISMSRSSRCEPARARPGRQWDLPCAAHWRARPVIDCCQRAAVRIALEVKRQLVERGAGAWEQPRDCAAELGMGECVPMLSTDMGLLVCQRSSELVILELEQRT